MNQSDAEAVLEKNLVRTHLLAQHEAVTQLLIIEILSEDFEDQGRYRQMENSIATTWLISFEQIHKQDPLAVEYLSFMAFLARESIPQSLLLPGASMNKEIKAIGAPIGYSFVSKQQSGEFFDMH